MHLSVLSVINASNDDVMIHKMVRVRGKRGFSVQTTTACRWQPEARVQQNNISLQVETMHPVTDWEQTTIITITGGTTNEDYGMDG
jgi:acetolactate synthase regulatory subunit